MKSSLLIVDDEKPTREGLRQALTRKFECYIAANTKEAKNVLKTIPIDILLTDLRIGNEDGMELLSHSLSSHPEIINIMMTAYGSQEIAVKAMKQGAWDFIMKPLNLDEVEILLKRAIKERNLTKENSNLKKQVRKESPLKKIIGKSRKLEHVLNQIDQIAPSKATVLIEGESGTGKELIAYAIHQLSGRPLEKLMIVNCSALAPQLLESELFGHEKGAFTGALQTRKGRFEEAHQGTIFLDEIGEIDSTTQVKLLRVLSEKTIERIGSNSPIPIDVRIICATNKNLEKLVQQKKFREDLFFRLNVMKIEIPPLRQRTEDIILLSNSFVKEFCKENNKPNKILSDEAIQIILKYIWPGNVRQLRTAIEHGVVMSNGDKIDKNHLPQFLFSKKEKEESKNYLNLKKLEEKALLKSFQITQGNRKKMAELLGISTRTLQRKIHSLKEKLE